MMALNIIIVIVGIISLIVSIGCLNSIENEDIKAATSSIHNFVFFIYVLIFMLLGGIQ